MSRPGKFLGEDRNRNLSLTRIVGSLPLYPLNFMKSGSGHITLTAMRTRDYGNVFDHK